MLQVRSLNDPLSLPWVYLSPTANSLATIAGTTTISGSGFGSLFGPNGFATNCPRSSVLGGGAPGVS